ncbi:hypothetical protein AB0M02_37465 [Actinoplanes sp. NPDC051861]|uniref:hypothetical protein n=1 Tax=Actinoplanes sp. NPDC051861 TaxID=3155170 RepID=UPI003422B783
MNQLADQIDLAAAALDTMDRRVLALAPGAAAFGADEAGRPGRIGRALFAGWTAVLAARAREAADNSQRLRDIAGSIRTTAQEYTSTDDAVRHRFLRGL